MEIDLWIYIYIYEFILIYRGIYKRYGFYRYNGILFAYLYSKFNILSVYMEGARQMAKVNRELQIKY